MKKRILISFICCFSLFHMLFSQQAHSQLSYASPNQLGIDSLELHRQIDSIVHQGILAGAFPGCQVLAAHQGKIFFHQSYGHHSYAQSQTVQLDDLYDLASLTKVSAALPAIMKLYEQGKIKLDTPMAVYWPDFERGRKKHITVREVLAHQSGLKPYISYYEHEKRRNGSLKPRAVRTDSSATFAVKLTDSLWLRSDYAEHIYKRIKRSRLKPKQGYVYSGLAFYLIPEIVKQQTGIAFDQYLRDSLYLPIGASHLLFNPLDAYSLSQIVPTERDSFFRHQLLHGIVHDEGAAMMSGVSGNAGLFGNSLDLAKLLQLYLNGGTYGEFHFLSDSTLKAFSKQQYEDNRRGLGFDKPLLTNPERGYAAPSASKSSFGHSGYTGTMWWVDPEHELIFIFLSNRVYPTRKREAFIN